MPPLLAFHTVRFATSSYILVCASEGKQYFRLMTPVGVIEFWICANEVICNFFEGRDT